jgi:hypothetical protein
MASLYYQTVNRLAEARRASPFAKNAQCIIVDAARLTGARFENDPGYCLFEDERHGLVPVGDDGEGTWPDEREWLCMAEALLAQWLGRDEEAAP